jgi:hypothetical protein
MRLIPKEEQEETLKVLEKNYETLTNEVRSLPVASDSRALKIRRAEIEFKLEELDKAIKLFKLPKVYVAKD